MDKRKTLKQYLTQLPDYVYTFIEYYYDGESINTQLAYALDLRVFFTFLSGCVFCERKTPENVTVEDLNRLKLDDLIEYKAYLKEYEVYYTNENGYEYKKIYRNSATGINRKLSSVRSLFSYLYKTDRISQNITEKLDLQRLKHKIKKPLTTQETVRLLDVIFNGERYFTGRFLTEYEKRKQRDIALYVTYLGTGVRVSELVNLNLNDVDFDTSSFIVRRKGGDEDEIFMPLQVENELFTYTEQRKEVETDCPALFLSRKGDRLTISSVEQNLKNYCKAAGIFHPDKTRPHALRRTFACNLLEDGVDIKMVAELMGHKNIEVTHKFYAQHSMKARRELMQSRTIEAIQTQTETE